MNGRRGHAAARALQELCDRLVAARRTASREPAPSIGDAGAEAVSAAAVSALVEIAFQVVEPTAADAAALGALCESAMGLTVGSTGDALEVRGTAARRTTGTHYTPRALAAGIVETGLAPLLARPPGVTISSEEILALRVADPAMGAGVFLLAALDRLAAALLEAWAREGGATKTLGDARRAVALGCLFGIDKSPVATRVARRSIALAAGLDEPDAAALDGALVCGDALVGLDRDALADAGIAGAEDAVLAADLLVGAFFSRDHASRVSERQRRVAVLDRWKRSGAAEDDAELRALQRDARRVAQPFHAALVWPRMDAIVGNPPFLGGKRISTELGATFADWLAERHGANKNTDLAAVFLLLAGALANERATINLITTNSLAEGETRRCGLGVLVKERGWTIYDATRSTAWPGDASVFVSVVHLARALGPLACTLDGQPVAHIDSRLRSARERTDPSRLPASQGVCFIGCFLRGKGFVLDAARAADLRAGASPREADVVRPFLGGEEVNTSPTQSAHRFVIDLAHVGGGSCSLDEATTYPRALAHLDEAVKPERLSLPRGGANDAHRTRWWLFANTRPELRKALRGLARCLVIPRVSPRLNVAWQPTDRVFSDQLCVLALDRDGHLAVLQSRVHAVWAARHASTLGEGLRYTPSTCLETFPFPLGDPRASSAELDGAGHALHQRRAEALVELELGLTELGHLLGDPTDSDPRVAAVRAAARDAERAVLDAYGWNDLGASAAGTHDERFDAVVVERLLDLNAARARHARA